MLVALTPSALSELRDRGLLAYHLNDVTGALRDLQTYLKLSSMSEMDREAREEHEQIWEHVKTLHRRVAALNYPQSSLELRIVGRACRAEASSCALKRRREPALVCLVPRKRAHGHWRR